LDRVAPGSWYLLPSFPLYLAGGHGRRLRVKKKRNQRRGSSVTVTSQERSSTLAHLLFRHRPPPTFPLAKEIREFNVYWKKSEAPRSLDERLEAFAKEKNWTDDDRKNFRIMSAIKDGWSLIFDKTAKKHLIAQKGGQGEDWVYKYQCLKCKSVDQRGITRMLSQYQYNHLPEDEALGVTDMKRCPNDSKAGSIFLASLGNESFMFLMYGANKIQAVEKLSLLTPLI
jgi:hypothetical protein